MNARRAKLLDLVEREHEPYQFGHHERHPSYRVHRSVVARRFRKQERRLVFAEIEEALYSRGA